MNIELTTHQKDLLVDLSDALFYLREFVLTIEYIDVRDELLSHIDTCLSHSAIFHLQEIFNTVYTLEQTAAKICGADELHPITKEIRYILNKLHFTLHK